MGVQQPRVLTALEANAVRIRHLEDELTRLRRERVEHVMAELAAGRPLPEVARESGLSESRVKHYRSRLAAPSLENLRDPARPADRRPVR